MAASVGPDLALAVEVEEVVQVAATAESAPREEAEAHVVEAAVKVAAAGVVMAGVVEEEREVAGT